MKIEVREEFSPVYGKNMFRLYVDGGLIDSFHTEALAMEKAASLKLSYIKAQGPRVVYSEVV